MSTHVNTPSVEPGLQADQRLLDRAWMRIGAGLAVAAQAMVFSLAVNLSEVEGFWIYATVHGILISAAVGSLVFLGGDLVRSAWEAMQARRVSIDLLFLVTLGGALGGSLISTFTHAGSVYYEVVAVLIVVHTAGKMLGARSRVAALKAVGDVREKFDYCERVRADGSTERIQVNALGAGEQVRVAPGAAIAVDGVIIEGRGYIQETSMTGEWRPESRGPGDRVLAGTFSVDGSLVIRADGGARRIDAILSAVEQARLAPSQLQAQADRLMTWFLPLVMTVSGLTFVGWVMHGPWERALFNAMAVLLVACPCAMGLATPVAVWGGLARLARFGLVARSGDVLDELSRVDCVCIDKTGTLSADQLSVRRWVITTAFTNREAELKAVVAVAESGLRHPVAEALCVSGAPDVRVKLLERRVEPGLGVRARVQLGEVGYDLTIGERELGGDSVKVSLAERVGKWVSVFVTGELAAEIELEETWRAGFAEALAELSAQGVVVEILSGDPQAATSLGAVFSTWGNIGGAAVAVHAGMMPQEKCARVEASVCAGRRVAFVGDGVNDAAAMSAAHVSIAMGGGAELARAASMAVFVGNDLRFLPEAMRVAKATARGIRQNLWFASVYNIVGMALAAAGMLHPVAAALLMVGSSGVVAVRALRSSGA